MSLGKIWRERFWKRAGYADFALVKFSCIAFGVMLAVLIPALTRINIWYITALFVVLAIKPVHTMLKR